MSGGINLLISFLRCFRQEWRISVFSLVRIENALVLMMNLGSKTPQQPKCLQNKGRPTRPQAPLSLRNPEKGALARGHKIVKFAQYCSNLLVFRFVHHMKGAQYCHKCVADSKNSDIFMQISLFGCPHLEIKLTVQKLDV